ncbi:MAG: [citrate (pro-3S)-lyase] ligase [Exilispira sp.]|jgi:[citrate (pro-3S)-lyase] ligase|nr:[citrate (pro-3S)-lyase] ligase [Exilispira sp.]
MLFFKEDIYNLEGKSSIPNLLKNLWHKYNLDVKLPIDKVLILTSDLGKIAGIIGFYRNIIKGLAIDPDYQGENITGKLLTWAFEEIKLKNYSNFLVYTNPKNIDIFSSFGFSLIEKTIDVALLERGKPDFNDYLLNLKSIRNSLKYKAASSIIVNCNPMTNGHLYLIEKVAEISEHLFIFILEEELSYFPFKYRFEIVKKATKHLDNITILPSSQYIISAATFPDYFLKDLPKDQVHAELDVAIFGNKIAPVLAINKRFVGEEPYCQVTSKYNETMQKLLPKYGIEFTILERKKFNDKAISASTVRQYIREDKFDEIKKIVPLATYEFLVSKEAIPIIEEIKNTTRRH